MSRKNFAFIALAAMAAFAAAPVYAAAGCKEKIVKSILHSNGQVYFTTDQTCPNWCQINWGSASNNKNALAMLLSAKLAERPIVFYWSAIASCADKNVTGASPDYMELQ